MRHYPAHPHDRGARRPCLHRVGGRGVRLSLRKVDLVEATVKAVVCAGGNPATAADVRAALAETSMRPFLDWIRRENCFARHVAVIRGTGSCALARDLASISLSMSLTKSHSF